MTCQLQDIVCRSECIIFSRGWILSCIMGLISVNFFSSDVLIHLLGNTVLMSSGEGSSPHSPFQFFTHRCACVPEAKDLSQNPSYSLCLLVKQLLVQGRGWGLDSLRILSRLCWAWSLMWGSILRHILPWATQAPRHKYFKTENAYQYLSKGKRSVMVFKSPFCQ